MRWGVRRLLQKKNMGKKYDSDHVGYEHEAWTDKKYGKAMQKVVKNDKTNIMGMKNKYEIKAKRSLDDYKYYNLNYDRDRNKVNAKRASKISDKMNKEFEKNKGTLTKIAANKSRAYSFAGMSFLASAAVAISKFGNPGNQRLMNIGKNLMTGGILGVSVSGAGLVVGTHYSDKQFKAENDIYSRTKCSTRI